MDVARAVAEVGGDPALDEGAVDLPLLVVDLLDDPDPAGDGDLVPDRRRLDDGAQLLGTGPDGVLDVLLEDRVELVVVDDPLPGQAHDQAPVLRQVDVVDLQQVAQEQAVVILGDPVKTGQGQDPGGQLGGGHLAAGGQGAHGLVVEQAVGQALRPGRLHKPLLDIELDQGNALDQEPGDHLRQHGPRLRVVLPHDEPHLGRVAPPAGPAHPLQKARHREGGVDLEGPLQAADVDPQLQGRGRADAHERVVVLHLLLCALPVGGGQIAVVDEEALRLVHGLAVLTQALADRLALLS